MKPALTLTQKILARRQRGGGLPLPGNSIRIGVDWIMASELALNGMMNTFQRLNNPPLRDPAHFYLAIDHTVDPVTVAQDPATQRLVRLSRDFAARHGLTAFYDANETIMHTRFYRDHCLPGQIVVGADSHTTSHGALGAFAIGLGGADVAIAAITGETWLDVPEAISVRYHGQAPFGLTGKDIVLRTLGLLGRNRAALERSVEYGGPAAAGFSTDMRFTICNMTAELGGMNGIFAPDGETADFLRHRGRDPADGCFLRADENASFADVFDIDLHRLAPQVARPFSPDNVCDIDAVIGQPLAGCFIGACTTTEEELVLAALVLEKMWERGQRPRPGSKRLVVPGDLAIHRRLADAGLIAVFERAGFRIGVPGCHLCLGVGSERAGEGEIWLSSQNRNYRNRMGKGSLAWLSGAATVAASSASLTIADPRPLLAEIDRDRFRRILGRPPSPPARGGGNAVRYTDVALRENAADTGTDTATGLTGAIEGRVQRFGDHVDTDAIIPGEFCNLSDWRELGRHCFAHIRPDMAARCANGENIIVAGEAWGSGSAREHAAWALIGAGVKLVIARSFAATHRRNLVNEGLATLTVDDDDFFGQAEDGTELRVDLASGTITHCASGRVFRGKAPDGVAASILRAGGIVPMVLPQLQDADPDIARKTAGQPLSA